MEPNLGSGCSVPLTDPRSKSDRYSRNARKESEFSLLQTKFAIDDQYIGEPPHTQVTIDNLNDNIDENFLRRDLSKIGPIEILQIVRHPKTHDHLGLAKVEFSTVEAARSCVENYNCKQMMGRQLNVFKDVRFSILEKIKEAKLNPKPTIPLSIPKSLPHIVMPPVIAASPASNLVNPNTHPPILPPMHHQFQKTNPIGAIPSPQSLEYPLTTPSSGSSATPEPSGRQRLEDRIANLMKQPNCVLSTMVSSAAPPQATLSYRVSLGSNYEYQPNKPYYHSQAIAPFNQKQNNSRREHNDYRRSDMHQHQNHKESYSRYNKSNDKSDRYSHQSDDDGWNALPEIENSGPLNIELSEEVIEREVLPHGYSLYKEELYSKTKASYFKRLNETSGFQLLERRQAAHRAQQNEVRRKQDLERNNREHQRQLEAIFLNKDRATEIQNQAPIQRPQLTRERVRRDEHNVPQDDRRFGQADYRRRVNRSSAFVETERRGSHTSVESDRSSSASPSSESSESSFPSSASSSDLSERSFGSSSVSDSEYDSDQETKEVEKKEAKSSEQVTPDKNLGTKIEDKAPESELWVADALLSLTKQSNNDIGIHKSVETSAKKRKKEKSEVVGVASEYRAAKKFAGGRHILDDDSENIMVDDENLQEEKPEAKIVFAPRSGDEKKRMYQDLFGSLSEEDVQYLKTVHEDKESQKKSVVEIPFGSDNANKAHLYLRKQMIEGKAADGHPKWWRGCSRCDVIEVSEKGRLDIEETNYEDLTKAPIKSHVIQAANSSRRDNRGDQRRIAALNSDMDPDILKYFTTSTLQMRAKNLRFSRSKIHKWGLFACENIASGDAVIEYVGEKIRPSLADHREKVVYTNLPTHDGSSYFFRVDSDVIDATLKGNKARFINHSCNPNCIAKVIKHDNGTNSIVIYAKQAIAEDEEITYDYKFPREEGEEKIHCNCRAPNCQKYLN